MKGLLAALQVRSGEGRLVGALFGVFLLCSLGSMLGGAATDALLFARFGTGSLPVLYVALGVTILTATLGMTGLLARGARGRLYSALLLALAAVVLAARVLLLTNAPLAYPLVWLAANAVSSVQGLVGWGLAGLVCDTRQAKRLFPLFGAGGVLGQVIGGLATKPLAALIHSENLVPIWFAALLAAFALAQLLPKGSAAPRVAKSTVLEDLRQGFDAARQSPMLRRLALAIVLFSVLYYSLAFPFSQAATQHFRSADDLAGFLGIFSAAATGTAFVASLAVANRLFSRFGLMPAITTFAALYAGGFAILLVFPVFPVLVGFRFLQLAWMFGIAGTAYHAVFNVVPDERRDQARTFIDGVGTQTGTVVGGLLLIAGQHALQPWQLFAAGLVAGAVTTGALIQAGRLYAKALVDALRSGRPEVFHQEPEPFAWLAVDTAGVAAARAVASDPSPAARGLAAEALAGLPAGEARPLLEGLRQDDDDGVRLAAVGGLARLGDAAAVGALVSLTRSDDPAVRRRAIAALGKSRQTGAAPTVAEALADQSAAVRQAAAEAMGSLAPREAVDTLVPLLSDTDPAVRRAAAGAVAQAGAAAVEPLLAALGDPASERAALIALGEVEAVLPPPILTAYADERVQRALGRFAVSRAARAAGGEPHALLADSLLQAARRDALAAFRAWAALTHDRDLAAAVEGLGSTHSEQRATAIEAVESMRGLRQARSLLALWDDSPPAAIAPAGLDVVMVDSDPWIRECAGLVLEGAEQLKTLDTVPLLDRLLFLRKTPLLQDLDPADLKPVALAATEHVFPDGHRIVKEGDAGGEMFIVVSGAIRVEAGGGEIARRGPGDAVGEMALLDNSPRMASLVAEGEVRVLSLDAAHFESVLRERPEVGLAVIRTLSQRLRERP